MSESATCTYCEGAPLPKPEALPVLFDSIPQTLRDIPQWVCWKYEYRDGKKWTKPPCQTNGIHASSTDPQTWSTFEAVREAYEKGGFDGVGIVLTANMGIVGIDLDDLSREDASPFIDGMSNTYGEVSPSGKGFRIFAKGDLPKDGTDKDGFEIYRAGRYLTITGHMIDGCNEDIKENQTGIDVIYQYINNLLKSNVKTTTEGGERENINQWDDSNNSKDEVSKRFITTLSSNPSFASRFYANPSDTDDRSEHEFSICCNLVEYGYNNSEILIIMDELLPSNGSKWHGRDDKYKKATIEKAADRVYNKCASGKPNINISRVKDLRDQVELALDAMVKYNSPPTIFKQEMKLCRIVESTPGQYSIDRLDNGTIRYILSACANWMQSSPVRGSKIADMKFEDKAVYPPKPVVEAISGLHMWKGVPWLMGITSTPIVTPDGEIVRRPGFDEKTGFYYTPPAEFELPEMSDNPTQEDAIEAAKWLDDEIFHDFPFVDEASRTNMLGALITAVARTMINGCAPLILIDKPTPGSGATKLVKIVSFVSTGADAPLTKDPGTEEEWRKTVHSMLRDCKSLLCFDNVDADLSSSSLSQMLTSDNVNSRILGQSVQESVPNRATWMATGNGVRVAGDMTRRICLIQIDPKMAEPWTRTGFRHADLEQWIKDNRSEILTKIYTMVRAWFVAGKPASITNNMGSFEAWNYTIGNILVFAGRKDFMANALWIKELHTMADEWTGFIFAFHEHFGERYARASEIHGWMREEPELADVLPKEISDAFESRGAVKAIGNRISKQNHRRYKNGLMWDMKIDGHSKVAMYGAIKPRDQTIC